MGASGTSRDPGARKHAGRLEAQSARLEEVTRAVHAAGGSDLFLANASVYPEAFGHIVIAWMWLEQAGF